MKILILYSFLLFSSTLAFAQERNLNDEKLEMSEEQRLEIDKINKAWIERIQSIKNDSSFGESQKELEIKKNNEGFQKKINKVLGVSEDTPVSNPTIGDEEPAKVNINRSRSNIKGK